jgi:hypothetical protein
MTISLSLEHRNLHELPKSSNPGMQPRITYAGEEKAPFSRKNGGFG